MSKDFRAAQVETSRLIASGGITGTTAGLIIYSGSIASDRQGTTADPTLSTMLRAVGTDVFLFVSGTINTDNIGTLGTKSNVALFGGDVVVSGTLYAERQVVEVDSTVPGNFFVTGNMYVEPDTDSTTSVAFRNANGLTIFNVDSTNKRVGIGDCSTLPPGGILDIQGAASAGVSTLLVDHDDADVVGIDINLANTTAIGIDIDASNTSAVVLDITANSLTTGAGLAVATTATNDNAGALVKILQAGSRAGSAASIGLDIDFNTVANANARALRIDSEQTTGIVAEFDGDQVTTGQVISVSADSLVSGNALLIDDNSANTTARDTVKIVQNNASATSAIALTVQSDSDGGVPGLKIDRNHAGTTTAAVKGMYIDLDQSGDIASGQTAVIVGVDIEIESNLGVSSPGTVNAYGQRITMTGDTNGTHAHTGLQIRPGVVDSPKHIELLAPSNANDYCRIVVGAEGATTISTVDADTAAANLTLDADGKIVIEAVAGDEVVFNEGSADVDFRVETNNNTHMLFADGGTNKLAVGFPALDTIDAILHVSSSGNSTTMRVQSVEGAPSTNLTNPIFTVFSGSSDVFTVGPSGIVVNEDSNDRDFRIETDSITHAFFVDAGNDKVLINSGEGALTTQIHSDNDVAITVDSSGVVFNEDGHATNDFRVESNDHTGAILVDGGTGQIGIKTPGTTAANSYNDAVNATLRAIPLDVGLYFSGSTNGRKIISGDGAKGVALFGGDMQVSGAIGLNKVLTAPTGDSNEAVLYALEDSGTTKLYYKDSSNTQIGPLGSGGSLDDSYDTPDGGGTKSAGIGAVITADGQPVQIKVAGANTTGLAVTGSVIIGSGSDGLLPIFPGSDTNFFVSGSVGSKGTSVKGTSTFGGDIAISGSVVSQGVIMTPQSVANVVIPANYNAVLYGPTVTIDGTVSVGSNSILTIIE